MSVLDAYRGELRALLDTKCFLRRDQAARALFITDYPRRSPPGNSMRERLAALDYTVTDAAGLWLLDLMPARYARDLGALPPLPHAPLPPDLRSLCHSLRAGGDLPIAQQPAALLRLTLLRLDENAPERLFRELSAAAAVCKRNRTPLPSAAAILIEQFYSKEVPSC